MRSRCRQEFKSDKRPTTRHAPTESRGHVRIDIPDEDDPDFEWHGEHGVIINIVEDDAGLATGDDRDSVIYRVVLDDHPITIDARWHDLRPPFDEDV